MEGRRTAEFLFFFLVLLLASCREMGVEGKICHQGSGGFKGLCFSDRNCAQVCIAEGFRSGNCHGFRRRCVCQKLC